MRHRSVADSLAERNVQRVKTDTALSKVANVNVTDVKQKQRFKDVKEDIRTSDLIPES